MICVYKALNGRILGVTVGFTVKGLGSRVSGLGFGS